MFAVHCFASAAKVGTHTCKLVVKGPVLIPLNKLWKLQWHKCMLRIAEIKNAQRLSPVNLQTYLYINNALGFEELLLLLPKPPKVGSLLCMPSLPCFAVCRAACRAVTHRLPARSQTNRCMWGERRILSRAPCTAAFCLPRVWTSNMKGHAHLCDSTCMRCYSQRQSSDCCGDCCDD